MQSKMPSFFLEDAECPPWREDAKCIPWREDAKCIPWRGAKMPSFFLVDAECPPWLEDAKCIPWRGAKMPSVLGDPVIFRVGDWRGAKGELARW